MSLTLVKPVKGTAEWHVPLNDNFQAIMDYAQSNDESLAGAASLSGADFTGRVTIPTDALTVYVDPNGDDTHDGSKNAPLRSFFAAAQKVNRTLANSAAIYLADGIYDESPPENSGIYIYGKNILNIIGNAEDQSAVVLNLPIALGLYAIRCTLQGVTINTPNLPSATAVAVRGSEVLISHVTCTYTGSGQSTYGFQILGSGRITDCVVNNMSNAINIHFGSSVNVVNCSGTNNINAVRCNHGIVIASNNNIGANNGYLKINGIIFQDGVFV